METDIKSRTIEEAYGKPKPPTFHIYDSCLIVWGTTPKPGSDPIIGGDWKSYNVVRRLLKREGYTVGFDPEIKAHYKRIWKAHHAGRRKDVLFCSEVYPAGFKFEFYEDVIRDNPNGGKYHFDKMGKAPYLWRLSVQLIHRKIAALLKKRGFQDVTEYKPDTALGVVEARLAKNMESHPYIFNRPPESYNGTDGDGVLLLGGEVRYFRTRNGHLLRGTVYRGLGNVWDIVLNRTEVTHEATYGLFTYDPEKHPRKISLDPLIKMTAALGRAIKTQNFERAAKIRDAIRRVSPEHDFKAGDKVMVDNPKYHGPGVVQYVEPPLYVGVKLSNGNTWRYEWPTVKPEMAPVSAGK